MGNGCISVEENGVSSGKDYIITVKTGDKKGGGTDANVFIALFNENGEQSRDIPLDCRWSNDFEAGSEDDFPVRNLANFGSIKMIELGRDERFLGDDWFVELVRVRELAVGRTAVFPINRWIKANKRLKIAEYDCCLPQCDCNQDQRKQELSEKCKVYEYEVKAEGLPPQVKTCPTDESFSNDYKWDIIKLKSKLMLTVKLKELTTDKWDTPEGIADIYNDTLPRPSGMNNWRSDVEFAQQRLTGCNPTRIRLCQIIPAGVAVDDEMLRPFLEGLTIQEAIDAKRLFEVKYFFLNGLECTDGRLMPAPYALFFVNREKVLLPVAIQLFPVPSEDNPVFLPSDPEYTWIMAKMWFNVADASVHQACTHLAFTHLIMETVAVASHRCLSPSHPMFRLLAPHFIFLLAINSRALTLLVSEGGHIDKCMTMGRIGLFSIVRLMYPDWRLDRDGTLPTDIEERGVGEDLLPNYYYRDDALLLYDSINKYVTEVVVGHYGSTKDIIEDVELQRWAVSLTASPSEGGSGIQGVPGNGKIETKEQLVQILTSFIFISSVGHAAANFSQYDEYGFPPNYPAFLNGDPPRTKDPLTVSDIVHATPDKSMTLSTLLVAKLLSERGTNALGDFEVQYSYDSVGLKALENFRKDLKRVGGVIDQRNAKRGSPYVFLHPSEVPNAISI